jgi:hypothetical protein
MLDVIRAYERTFETYSIEAFGERIESETHAVSMLSPEAEYIELGYFKNGEYGSNYALTIVPSTAPKVHYRNLIVQQPFGVNVETYTEDSYLYLDGLDDYPEYYGFTRLYLGRQAELVDLTIRRTLIGATVLSKELAKNLQPKLRTWDIDEYREHCRDALLLPDGHVGRITDYRLRKWKSATA